MWFPLWLVIFILPTGGIEASSYKEARTFPDEKDCLAWVEKWSDKAPDRFRGTINLPWDFDISVKGICQQEGDPA